MKSIVIPCDRFILKTLTRNDVGNRYLSWINGSNKSQYIEYSNKYRDESEIYSYIDSKNKKNNVLFLGIFSKNTNEHIGNIKYEPIDVDNKTAVMGVLIGEKDWRGLGVASEVIKSSSKWLNKKYSINQIALGVNVKNVSAIKAYEKIGFKNKKTPCIDVTHEGHISMLWDIE